MSYNCKLCETVLKPQLSAMHAYNFDFFANWVCKNQVKSEQRPEYALSLCIHDLDEHEWFMPNRYTYK